VGENMTNNTNLIKQGKTSKIYYFLYTEQSTKYEILKQLNLRHNDVYNKNKIENNSFDLLYKNDYIEKIGNSERGSPIYQSTSQPLLEEIQAKLEKKGEQLTSFEQWVLKTIFNSPDTREKLKRYYAKDFKEEINAFNVIVDEYIGNFIFGNFVLKEIISDGSLFKSCESESEKKFLKVWNGDKDQIMNQIDQGFNIFVTATQKSNEQMSKLFLPKSLQNKQIKKYSNIPRETDFYSKWMALPISLIHKMILISPQLQNYILMLNDVMRTFLPMVIMGVIKPNAVFNQDLKNIIANKKKNIIQLFSRHSELDGLCKNNGTE
jgi:hypothetical protein